MSAAFTDELATPGLANFLRSTCCWSCCCEGLTTLGTRMLLPSARSCRFCHWRATVPLRHLTFQAHHPATRATCTATNGPRIGPLSHHDRLPDKHLWLECATQAMSLNRALASQAQEISSLSSSNGPGKNSPHLRIKGTTSRACMTTIFALVNAASEPRGNIACLPNTPGSTTMQHAQ